MRITGYQVPKLFVTMLAAIAIIFARSQNGLAADFDAGSTAWQQLPSLPDKEGFAGMFAGVSHGALLVAGGSNFPDKRPWEGGEKHWYDDVLVLERPDGKWNLAGKLPRPLGYGVSVTYRESLICVGGENDQGNYADAFRLEWRDGKLSVKTLPALPSPAVNLSGALVGDVLYVLGGQSAIDSCEALKSCWCMDLSADPPKWTAIEGFPGSGRILSVASGFGGAFWIAGGAELVVSNSSSDEPHGKLQRRYLRDAYRYELKGGWKRIADLPYPVVAGATPAPVDASGLYVIGGDDGSQVDTAPDKHRGFSNKILRYDVDRDSWLEAGEIPSPRVTLPCVLWKDRWVLPGGEVRPGVRSPEVWSWNPQAKP